MQNDNSTKLNELFTLLKYNWKNDLTAGFVVSLMALPMSLGVAIASGFPPIAGIITSIMGGMLIFYISGSQLTIKGPAGGLSAIMLSAVLVLGNGNLSAGYQYALAVVVVAGLLQIFFAMMKVGNFADFFPASTIHGMLAALGIAMAIKQLYLLLGMQPTGAKTYELFVEFPLSLSNLNPKIALVGLISLAIVIFLNVSKFKFLKVVPAPLIVILLAIPLGLILDFNQFHSYALGKSTYNFNPTLALISIPEKLIDGLAFPDFSMFISFNFWEHVILLAFACTIESVLSTKAIDKIDPLKRNSKQNKDLFAIGIGNIVSGFLGGLPMISESKRSVINLDNNGKTVWSNFFHGLFLVIIVFFLLKFIKLIPTASLAALLVYTGFRMATPTEFSKSFKIGTEQFLVFIVTFLLTIFSNFIVGIIFGVITELIIHLRFGVKFKHLFNAEFKVFKDKLNNYELRFKGPVIFSNYLDVKNVLEKLPKETIITFDFSKARVVDHTFMEHLQNFEKRRAFWGGQIAIAGLDYHKHLSDHPLAAKRIVKQNQLTDRQLEIKNFALSNNIIFDHRMVTNVQKFSDFNMNQGIIRLEENVLKSSFGSINYAISDILVENDINTTAKQNFKMTIMQISNQNGVFPEFTLQKEGFIDTLFALSGFNDIDFEEHPSFSYYYLLKGPKESEIRRFFNSDVIKFFEANKGFHIDSKSDILLIYKRPALLSIEEIDGMIKFGEKFISLVYDESDLS